LYGLNTFSDDGCLLALGVPDPRDDRNIYQHRRFEILARFMTMAGFRREIPIRQFHMHLVELGEISRKIKVPNLKNKIKMKFYIRNKWTFKYKRAPLHSFSEMDFTFKQYLKQQYEIL
jgi:hypothetical protein